MPRKGLYGPFKGILGRTLVSELADELGAALLILIAIRVRAIIEIYDGLEQLEVSR